MNLGTVGFLLNGYRSDDLAERIAARPAGRRSTRLRMRADLRDGGEVEAIGINEVSIFRETRQAAQLAHRDRRRGAACPSWSATASWWRPRPAAPPTTSPPTGRSSRSAPTSWR